MIGIVAEIDYCLADGVRIIRHQTYADVAYILEAWHVMRGKDFEMVMLFG